VVLYIAIQGGLVMKLGRIMGVILSILVTTMLISYYYINNKVNNNSIELIGDSVSTNDYEDIIKYTNNQNYSIDIEASNVNITCHGENESDEDLVKSNMKISALFSNSINGNKEESINIKSKESIYIHVVKEYTSDIYPSNDVTCDYSIDIKDF
jgi:hypothetical protein